MSDDRKPTIRFRGFTDAESAEVVHVSADALDRALCGAAAEGRDQGLSWEWADKEGALSDELVRRLRAVQWSVTGEPCADGNVDETCAAEAAARIAELEAKVTRLVEAVRAEIDARQTYDNMLADRGGSLGPKGRAIARWMKARADVIAAFASVQDGAQGEGTDG